MWSYWTAPGEPLSDEKARWCIPHWPQNSAGQSSASDDSGLSSVWGWVGGFKNLFTCRTLQNGFLYSSLMIWKCCCPFPWKWLFPPRCFAVSCLWKGGAYSSTLHHLGMGSDLVGSAHLDGNQKVVGNYWCIFTGWVWSIAALLQHISSMAAVANCARGGERGTF